MLMKFLLNSWLRPDEVSCPGDCFSEYAMLASVATVTIYSRYYSCGASFHSVDNEEVMRQRVSRAETIKYQGFLDLSSLYIR